MPLRKLVLAAVFTALLVVATQFAIPIGPVPVTLQPFVVMLAGLMLGRVGGVISVLLWALLGSIGFPVFAGGKAGISILIGPTGGFVLGFMVCAFIIGALTERRHLRLWPTFGVMLLGLSVTYAVGLAGFLCSMRIFLHKPMTLQQGLILVVYPFIPWDIAKAALASFIGIKAKNALNANGYSS